MSPPKPISHNFTVYSEKSNQTCSGPNKIKPILNKETNYSQNMVTCVSLYVLVMKDLNTKESLYTIIL